MSLLCPCASVVKNLLVQRGTRVPPVRSGTDKSDGKYHMDNVKEQIGIKA